ncbi:MAG: FAD-dependent oxidoreductase [Proteobacteria bacterium]|nr:FAD-dependent oxidoreductase [Pseudomonadota bacterium]NIS71284.1 FAD-dependent oxidoreductase [Pseudomonadota bacterium]
MGGDGSKKRLIFVGGGHVHLLSLKNADRFVREGAEVILIGPDRFHYYSGMGPGLVSRIYGPDQVRFDVQRMVEDRGGVFIRDKAVSLDAASKTLLLQGGARMAYDLVSFNIGSYVPMDRIPGAEKEAIPVKPIESLEMARGALLKKLGFGSPKVLIVGAGPAGVELAGNMWRFVQNENARAEIILANSSDRVLPNFPRRASTLAQDSLSRRGIRVLPNFRVASLKQGLARSESGEETPFDLAILTIGITPQKIFAESGLETAEDGALMVNDYLQSTSSLDIFGGGDCIALKENRLDRVGVYAVREAPILFHNLLARLKGEPLQAFRPQKRYLLIFNLGDGSGLFVRGSWVWKGKLAFAVKNYLDRRFMSEFQVSGETG